MSNLDKTIMLKKPAVVVRVQPPTRLMLGGPRDRHTMMAEAIKLHRKGIVRIVDDAPRWNQQAGRYELRVIPLRQESPTWAKPLIVAGSALFVLAVLLILAWRAVQELTTGAGLAFLVAFLLAFITWTYRRHRTQVTVTTTITVRR